MADIFRPRTRGKAQKAHMAIERRVRNLRRYFLVGVFPTSDAVSGPRTGSHTARTFDIIVDFRADAIRPHRNALRV